MLIPIPEDHGELSPIDENSPLKEVIERINKRTLHSERHWLFQGTSPKGYGQIRYQDKMISTHRISAAYYLGLDLNDPTQQANHKIDCPYKNCWNPTHLYIGTETENRADRQIKNEEHTGNQYTNATHCVNGHDISTPDKYYKYGSGQRKCKQCYKNRYDKSRGR